MEDFLLELKKQLTEVGDSFTIPKVRKVGGGGGGVLRRLHVSMSITVHLLTTGIPVHLLVPHVQWSACQRERVL